VLIFGTLTYHACFKYAYFNQNHASRRAVRRSPAYNVGGVRERGKNKVILDRLPREGLLQVELMQHRFQKLIASIRGKIHILSKIFFNCFEVDRNTSVSLRKGEMDSFP